MTAKIDDPEPATEVEPEGVIEGVVNGENEVETLNEEGQGAAEADDGGDDVTAMVEAGNMEQLASLVLNGEGDRLIGQSSDNPELQSFLDNVQVYMVRPPQPITTVLNFCSRRKSIGYMSRHGMAVYAIFKLL